MWIQCQINEALNTEMCNLCFLILILQVFYCSLLSLHLEQYSVQDFSSCCHQKERIINPTEARNTLPLEVPAEPRAWQEPGLRSSASYRSKCVISVRVRNSWPSATNDFSTYRPHASVLARIMWKQVSWLSAPSDCIGSQFLLSLEPYLPFFLTSSPEDNAKFH